MKLSNPLITLAVSLSVSSLIGCQSSQNSSANNANEIWLPVTSEVKKDEAIEDKIQTLLRTMTIEQKVAQMIQPEIRDITPEDMRKYGFGSYLNGGGAFPDNNKHATPNDWIKLAEAMYQASIDDSLDGSTIPTMWGTDAVHGHNNVIGATLFPHNIGLGAANNPDLIEKIAQITATEVMVTGIDWVFAPTVATVRDDRWGRTYEGYSEDPEIVKSYAASIVKGLQGTAGKDFLADDRVISTVKHFLGDGGTVDGDDQGNNIDSEQALYDIHAQGYVSGLAAGSQSVMASFNSWHGKKNHGNKYLLTTVLKDKMGFDGFVVGDWNGHGQIKGCTNESCPQAVNAGLDIFMVPTDAWKPLYENTVSQIKRGVISMKRIDDAVARILRVKFRANLFTKPSPEKRMFSGKTELIGAKAHRDVARQAVRESLVLLKNKQQLLPLSPKQTILVAGDAADNIGKQSGGWSITWQGTNNQNSDFPGATSIYAGLAAQVNAAGGTISLSETGEYNKKPDVAIVVFGEEPYAEGQGDRAHLAFQTETKKDLALLKKLQSQGIPTVSVFITGRPMWVNAELNASDAFVVAWLPGTEGAGIADVILKGESNTIQHDFVGKLSFSWPKTATQIVNRFDENYQPLLPYGFGLTYQNSNVLADNLDETFNIETTKNNETPIFNGGLDAAWKMTLFSNADEQAVAANSHQLVGLNYRTIDKVVQEDAFRLSFNGQENAGVRFIATEPAALNTGLENTLDNKTHLLLHVKMNTKPVAATNVWLAIDCDSNEKPCDRQMNLSEPFKGLAINQWQELLVPLSCVTGAVKQSLALSTSQPLDISVASITLVNTAQNGNVLTCQ